MQFFVAAFVGAAHVAVELAVVAVALDVAHAELDVVVAAADSASHHPWACLDFVAAAAA